MIDVLARHDCRTPALSNQVSKGLITLIQHFIQFLKHLVNFIQLSVEREITFFQLLHECIFSKFSLKGLKSRDTFLNTRSKLFFASSYLFELTKILFHCF